MSEIKVNEEMTELAMMAHNIAKLKRYEPEAYDVLMREMTNDAKRSLESDLDERDQFTAMCCKSVMETMFKRLYDDPFALIEIEQMVQEIDHMKEDKES